MSEASKQIYNFKYNICVELTFYTGIFYIIKKISPL